MSTIKLKRGLKLSLPTLAEGELGYCTDTDEIYIGEGSSNKRIAAEILDEDTMVSDSDECLATQQSIKSYVDDNTSLIQDSLIANGAITIGDPVSVDYNGDIEKTQVLSGTAVTNASKTSFSSVTTYYPDVVMIDSTHFVLSFRDDDNEHGIAKVGTISGSTISYGSDYNWITSTDAYYTSLIKIGTNKIVVSFYDNDNTRVSVIVGTISGSVITFGTQVSLTNSKGITTLCEIDTDKFGLSYTNATTNDIETVIATVSGTVPSFGTPSSTTPASQSQGYKLEALSSTKIVLVYDSGSSSNGSCRVGTISGTTISYGTASAFSTNQIQRIGVGVLSDSSYIISADPMYSEYPLEIHLMSVSGTVSTNEDLFNVTPIPNVFYDPNVNVISENRVIISGVNDVNYLMMIVDIDGDKIVSIDQQLLETYDYRSSSSSGSCWFEDRKLIIAQGDRFNGYNGVSFIQEYADDNRKDYIGISQDTVSDGEQVTVKSYGAIDYNQSSLTPATPYYIDNTGTLSTSADDGFKVGKSISSTSLLISENQEILDEDDMISDSDSFICTQQSIKSYVDNNDNIAQFAQAGNNISVGDPVGLDDLNNVSKMSSESVVFEKTVAYSTDSVHVNTACRLTDTTFVVMWINYTTDIGYVSHGTVASDHSTTYGTPVQFDTSLTTTNIDICRLSDTSFAIVWDEDVKVGTVSGTTITLGTVYSGGTNSSVSRITGLSATQFVVQFDEYILSEYVLNCIPCSVSGTTITAGTLKEVIDAYVNNTEVNTIDSTHILISYNDLSQKFVVGTVDGLFNTLTLGTPVQHEKLTSNAVEVLDSTHFVILSDRTGDDGQRRLCNTIGTISGNSISFSDTVDIIRLYDDSSIYDHNIAVLSATKYINFWGGTLVYGNDDTYYNICNVSNGDEITSEMIHQHDFPQQFNTLFGLTSTKAIYVTNYATGAISLRTNRSLDFMGIAQEADPSNYIRVKTSGQVDDNQSSLEVGEYYFISHDGELTTYPTTQPVGKAIETDKILIDTRTLTPIKNLCINGNFDHWQRDSSSTANGYGSADRCLHTHSATSKTVSRQAFTVGQTDVPNSPKYYLRHQITTAGTGTAHYAMIGQKIKDVTKLADKRLFVSFWARPNATSKRVVVEVYQNLGSGTIELIPAKQIYLHKSTGWAHYITHVDMPSVSGKTIGDLSSTRVNIWMDGGTDYRRRIGLMANGAWTCDISNMEIYAGTRPMPVEQRTSEEELNECYKYCVALTSSYRSCGSGVYFSTTSARLHIPLPCQLIQDPHTITYNSATSTKFRLSYTNVISSVTATPSTIYCREGSLYIIVTTPTGINKETCYVDIGDNSKIIFDSEL